MLSKKIVKYIQSLSHKKFRDEEGVLIAEGSKIVGEFLSASNMKCQIVCADKSWLSENESLLKNIDSEKIFETDDYGLQSISLLKTPNKVVAVFQKKDLPERPDISRKISLMLDDLQDPGNLGTLIRIADWFAVENIICSENSVDCYNSKVIQSTMGSFSRVNVFYTDLFSFIERNKKIPVYGTTLHGTSIYKLPKIKEGIILIGNESKGIQENILKITSHQITIPKLGHAESLNAAVAGGIILSHIFNS